MTDDGPTFPLDGIDIFAGLTDDARQALTAEFEQQEFAGGEVLIREGEPARSLYVVVSGRFKVTRRDQPDTLSEIGSGQTIGEIAFFAGGARTATVTALRDSLVLCIDRAAYGKLALRLPSIANAILATLARRLNETSTRRLARPDPRPNTIAVIAAGDAAIDRTFVDLFVARLMRVMPVTTVDSGSASSDARGSSPTHRSATEALNRLERLGTCVVYIADRSVTDWSHKCIRQADMVLLVAHADAGPALNEVERMAMRDRPPRQIGLVLLHPKRHEVRGTARWLKDRTCFMHHHVALDTHDDVDRLVRFLTGAATGLVAGGGGALSVAHVGVYRALREAGLTFDIMGGTSGGSAMTAAFAAGVAPDDIVRLVGECFVERKAMRRFTLPRYGLIDHTHYDAELARLFGDRTLEDLWIPYFCVSTNLSENRVEVHRTGSLWQAVRASGSIPVLLPPFYTPQGDMLVDGGLMDNVPVRIMRDLKSGPNVVLSLETPKSMRFDVKYADLPSRNEILRTVLTPFGGRRLPQAPGILAVLLRALVSHRQDYERFLSDDDLHLRPPVPADMGLLDWHRREEVYRTAYHWCRQVLARRAAERAEKASAPAAVGQRTADATFAGE